MYTTLIPELVYLIKAIDSRTILSH